MAGKIATNCIKIKRFPWILNASKGIKLLFTEVYTISSQLSLRVLSSLAS